MNVRAYLHDTEEYFYPPTQDNVGLVEFYSVLEGYKIRGRDYTLDYGSGKKDVNGNEIFNNDLVTVYFIDDKTTGIDDAETEDMEVAYEYCCFVLIDDNDLYYDLGNFFVDEEEFLITIKGRVK